MDIILFLHVCLIKNNIILFYQNSYTKLCFKHIYNCSVETPLINWALIFWTIFAFQSAFQLYATEDDSIKNSKSIQKHDDEFSKMMKVILDSNYSCMISQPIPSALHNFTQTFNWNFLNKKYVILGEILCLRDDLKKIKSKLWDFDPKGREGSEKNQNFSLLEKGKIT